MVYGTYSKLGTGVYELTNITGEPRITQLWPFIGYNCLFLWDKRHSTVKALYQL